MRVEDGVSQTSWIGWLVNRGDSYLRAAMLSLVGGALSYGIVAIIAWIGGFGRPFVHTPQTWILGFETSWVLFFGGWSTRALAAFPDAVGRALSPRRAAEYGTWARGWQNRVFSPVYCLLGGFLLDLGLGLWFFLGGRSWERYFGHHWIGTHHALHATCAFLLFLPCGPLLATMIWGFALYFVFVLHALQRFELLPIPDVAADELRPITTFGLFTGLGWSVAVALGVWFFDRHLAMGNETVAAILGAMALLLIVAPQWIAHTALVRTRTMLFRAAAAGLPGAAPAQWVMRNVDADGALHRRREFIKDLRETPVWIYSPTQLVLLIAEVAIPVVSLIVKHGS